MKKAVVNNLRQTKLIGGHKSIAPLPVVVLTMNSFLKIISYTQLCPFEISGMGMVDVKDGVFTIRDVFILKQTVTPVHAEIDPVCLNQFISDLSQSGGNTADIKFQWHSHAKVPAFFSVEDIETIKSYFGDFMISFVTNHNGDYQCRIDITQPIPLSIEVPVYLKIAKTGWTKVREECRAEIEEKVEFFGSPQYLYHHETLGGFVYVELDQLRRSDDGWIIKGN